MREYNESIGAIHRTLTTTAKMLTDETCHVTVSYGGVLVFLAGDTVLRRQGSSSPPACRVA